MLEWSFDLDFERTGVESTYEFRMQLGDGSRMDDSSPDHEGVAVNLIWGGFREGLDDHQQIGADDGTSITTIEYAIGPIHVEVRVDLDARTYVVEVGTTTSGPLPFDRDVAIDTVRFYTDTLNVQNFDSRSIDNVRISAGSGGGAMNQAPVAEDQTVTVPQGASASITLAWSDADGPGPYTFSILSPPADGSLSGTAPDLTYTPDPDATGTDSFTWQVDDGQDVSEPGMVTLDIVANAPPTVTDFTVATSVDNPVTVDLAAHASDPDGPEPLGFTIVVPPLHGVLSGTGGTRTYTPDIGYTGPDSFTWRASDGLSQSAIATTTVSVNGDGDVLFHDRFDRLDSPALGNGWTEVESGASTAAVRDGQLVFDAFEEAYRPLVRRTFAATGSGRLRWSFTFDFARTAGESTYVFRMQLGQASLMSTASPDHAGVAVNLIWGGIHNGLSAHQQLAADDGTSLRPIGVISGPTDIVVDVDLDAGTYTVGIDGVTSPAFPFDRDVPIDAVRFFTDELNRTNFGSRGIDEVRIERP